MNYPKTIAPKIQEITKKIVKEYQPEKIILFGSYAWGKPTEDSDVDLLIIKNTTKRRFDRALEVRKKLFGDLPAIDLLVYTPKEVDKMINEDRNLFIEDVVNNGVVLYGND
jgi:predicted nucleotidyltransferase